MNTLVDCPQGKAGEWSFRLFGVPVHVKIWFWISTVVLCGANDTGGVLIWIAVCLASIVIHELGHVYAFRFFGTDADVVLYAWGGLAIPHRSIRGAVPQCVVALAGPVAGFCVAAIALGAAWVSGATIQAGWHLFLPVLAAVPAVGLSHLHASNYWYVLLNDLLWVNLYWGLVNLLPVHPFDGSHAAKAILAQRDPHRGKRNSLILSAVVAAAAAVFGIVERSLYLMLPFAILAVSSAQAAEGEGPSSPRPFRSPRW